MSLKKVVNWARRFFALSEATALCPLDGRYRRYVKELAPIFSEMGLVQRRLRVMVEYLIAVAPIFGQDLTAYHDRLRDIYRQFDRKGFARIKALENDRKIRHDVKAVELYIRQLLVEIGLPVRVQELVHIALTSEDVNNLAYSLQVQDGTPVLLGQLQRIMKVLDTLAFDHRDTLMLARTHGQAAVPSTFGKEMRVVFDRLDECLTDINTVRLSGKLNGAAGTYAAHLVARPDVDWQAFSRKFVESFGFKWKRVTTQIEPHDNLCRLFDAVGLANTIMIDLSQDIWLYVSLRLVGQKSTGVGSSTMPHKINPQDFENAIGNFLVAKWLLRGFSDTLPISKMQRDLTDSTILRNVGLAFGYTLQACKSLQRGLNLIQPNVQNMIRDINDHPEVLAEAIQTKFREDGVPGGYDYMKGATQGIEITLPRLYEIVDQTSLSEDAKHALMVLTPESYHGLAQILALQEAA